MNLTLKAQVILEALKYQGVSECLLLWDKPIWNQMIVYKKYSPLNKSMKAQVQLVVNFYCQVIYTSQGTGSLYHLNYSGFYPAPAESRRTQWSPACIFKACLRKLSAEESWPLQRSRACLLPRVVFTGKAGNYKTVTTAQKYIGGGVGGPNWRCQNL